MDSATSRVLFACQTFAPLFEGGTERVARAHAIALAELGCELAIVGVAPDGRGLETVVDGLPVTLLEEGPAGADPVAERLWLERPGRLAALLEVLDRWHPSVVHIQHHASLSLGLVEACRARGARVVVSLHDLFATCPRFFRTPLEDLACPPPGAFGACAACLGPEAPGHAPEALERALAERARRFATELEAADVLVAPSASHAARLEALLGYESGRIAVVPNGQVTPLQRPATPLALPSADQPLRLLSFGHLVGAKGVVELVGAASAAAARGARRIELTLAGATLEPGLDDQLRRLAGPLELVLAGSFEPSELPHLAARAHAAVFASKALESYGLVVDEALALGLPVLASDAGALGERIGGAGLVLPRPSEPEALACWTDALANLAEDPSQLLAWRAQIPDRMPGPREAAALLLDLYRAPRP